MKSLSPKEQEALFNRLTLERHKGKTTNYASTYNAGAQTIATGAGTTLKEGKELHKSYWLRNWSIKAIADEQVVKQVNGLMWMFNPVSKFWYILRSDKDRFSTLNQGTATFCFDMWLKEVRKHTDMFLGQFHDEVIIEVRKGRRANIRMMLDDCVMEVNKRLELNRELTVGVDFGRDYSEIH